MGGREVVVAKNTRNEIKDDRMNRDDCRTTWGSQFRSNEKSRLGMVERSGKKETKDCGELGNDEKQTERLKRD